MLRADMSVIGYPLGSHGEMLLILLLQKLGSARSFPHKHILKLISKREPVIVPVKIYKL